ncbi:hypothetical protein CCR75_001186 [Bremia lactucae]|uniref:Anamorsin homolog n=1 Tax=Bremia lactucae TaxID=4779 RepID=A0A976FPM5_BRELC|nr:hypothetical protein CCR75_001186 [Bremia lactucae]
MELKGEVAILTRLSNEISAVQQLKQSNPYIANVIVLNVSQDSNLVQMLASNAAAKANAFDAVVSFNEHVVQLDVELAAVIPLIKPNGILQLYVNNVQEEDKRVILMALMIGGLVDTTEKHESSPFFPTFSNAVTYSCKKQSLESPSISLTKKYTEPRPIKKWTVLADDFEGDEQDDDIIDEDTLLDDTDEVLLAAKADCGEKIGGKKRACKNCTCGLKDEKNQPVMSEKDLSKLVSGCGNCFKGDAFRCGSCPFLGKPAFKPGLEKVLLNLDNSDDI